RSAFAAGATGQTLLAQAIPCYLQARSVTTRETGAIAASCVTSAETTMDELHDAIQDAQYIGAVTNAHRGPSAAFYTPSHAELTQYIEKQERALGQDWLNLENMLDQPLGSYFFKRFCEAEQHGVVKLMFLVELTKFRSLIEPDQRVAKAKELWEQFCLAGPEFPTNAGAVAPGTPGATASGPLPTSLVTPTGTTSSSAATATSPDGSNEDLNLSTPRNSHRVGSIIQNMNVASFTNNGIVFWKKGQSTVRMADVAAIYRECASETSAIGVGGDVIKRVGTFLKRKVPANAAKSGQSPRATEMVIAGAPGEVNVSSSSPPTTSGRGSDSLTKQLSGLKSTSFSELRNCPTTLFDELEACVLCSLEQTHLKDFRSSVFHRRFVSFLYLQTRKVCEDDFTVLRVLGRGGFGMVNGCIKRTSASLYAMKVMNKKMIKKKHAEKLCVAERKILSMISSPFVVCLKYAFQTPEELFLVLDLRTGGDLSFHLNRCRFTEAQVRFWAAQILLGLQHLHEKNIVYRDLKPENILLDERGNCSISDLGLAVEVTPTLAGRCGTRGYWAPEMLLRDENGQRMVYNQVVDWWSYGCLVYELLYGKCPFRTSKAKALHEDKQQAYDKATLELTPTYDPKYFSPEATELITQLLIRDPKKRLGANGADEVKRMKFFDPVDWVKIESMSITPPFVPDNEINAASQADIGSFDVSVVKGVKLSEQDQGAYATWDYVCPETFQREAIEYLEWEVKNGPCTTSPHSNSAVNIYVRSAGRDRWLILEQATMTPVPSHTLPSGAKIPAIRAVNIYVRSAGRDRWLILEQATMTPVPSHTLPSGAKIPAIGLGVYQSEPGAETYNAVLSALKIGYRHVDTAQFYQNEEDVGRALKDSGIPRQDVFITTKLFINKWGYDAATEAVKDSVKKLGTGYVDLLLLHAPGDKALRAETWRALEDLQAQGLLRDIGVSNFGEAHLAKLADTAKVKPAINQVELHPWLTRTALVAYCKEHGILVQAYSPLAKANKLSDPVVGDIAKQLNATAAQVLIAWSLAKGFNTLPKSVNPTRQQQNLEVVNVRLTPEQIARLDALDEYLVTGWDPIKEHEV
ncbi:TPA: hypothetical protein N0F65_011746, partial [Lagenidium giganteum]